MSLLKAIADREALLATTPEGPERIEILRQIDRLKSTVATRREPGYQSEILRQVRTATADLPARDRERLRGRLRTAIRRDVRSVRVRVDPALLVRRVDVREARVARRHRGPASKSEARAPGSTDADSEPPIAPRLPGVASNILGSVLEFESVPDSDLERVLASIGRVHFTGIAWRFRCVLHDSLNYEAVLELTPDGLNARCLMGCSSERLERELGISHENERPARAMNPRRPEEGMWRPSQA